jgi:ribonucleotide monophosphatase NagD (HAD superfamily)
MRFAVDNGMCSIGVLSGEMTQNDIDESGMKLDYVFQDALELYDLLKQQ